VTITDQQVDVIPAELAKFARAQAERDRQHKQRFEPPGSVRVVVEAELLAAEAASGRG
jgi:hypothetical protein